MSTCRDRPCTAAHVTARQARDASKYFSVAPDHVLSCTESVGTLCYISRLVDGLPTIYSGNFFFAPTISTFFSGITQAPTSKWCGLKFGRRICKPWQCIRVEQWSSCSRHTVALVGCVDAQTLAAPKMGLHRNASSGAIHLVERKVHAACGCMHVIINMIE
jgi:hypothetical protein